MIGTTADRQPVISEFKKKQLVQVKGATLTIRDRPALENMLQPAGPQSSYNFLTRSPAFS